MLGHTDFRDVQATDGYSYEVERGGIKMGEGRQGIGIRSTSEVWLQSMEEDVLQ